MDKKPENEPARINLGLLDGSAKPTSPRFQ